MKQRFENRNLELAAEHTHGFRAYPPMFHVHAELVFVMKGTLRMTVEGVHCTLHAGEVGMVFPYCLHSYEESNDVEALVLLFSPFTSGVYASRMLSHKPTSARLPNADTLLPSFLRVLTFYDTENKERMDVAGAYLSALVGELLLTVPLIRRDAQDATLTQRIFVYCAEHYREQLSVKELSKALYVSESTITKIFSLQTGGSFRKYLNELRVGEAKRLLRERKRKIVDVMLECGFCNQSSFNRVFLESVGMTPREFRLNFER
ncbi:MAG: helix-turn-helix domain-containing protein [Ruminococcaceae bacterium]|nr:helix-turn-helix domain-containing protein [Oscillospiraceae bacterium]